MKAEEARILWIFVFFDLPVGSKPWKQMTAEITELEQAVAEAQARTGGN